MRDCCHIIIIRELKTFMYLKLRKNAILYETAETAMRGINSTAKNKKKLTHIHTNENKEEKFILCVIFVFTCKRNIFTRPNALLV